MDISKHRSTLKKKKSLNVDLEDLDNVKKVDYAISEHHHAGSNFLKVSAAFIAVGHILNLGLNIAMNSSTFHQKTFDTDNEELDCRPVISIASDSCHIIYVVLQVSFHHR